MPQLQPVAHVSGRQPQLQRSSAGRGVMMPDLSKSSVDVHQLSLPSQQQQCKHESVRNTVDNVRAAAWQHVQPCNSQTPVSLTSSAVVMS